MRAYLQVAGGVSEETRSIAQRLNTDVSAMQRDVDAQRMEGKVSLAAARH